MHTLNLADVEAAADRIAGQIVETRCSHSRVLSALTGAEVWLKFENLQFTASFKERGALNALLQLSEDERAAGVAAVSAGNHAQGVAHHATRLGIRSVIVMPRGSPFTKIRSTRELGGEVVLEGETLAEAAEYMQRELIEQRGMTLIHPYDDLRVMAGQGTVALEMLARAPALETLVVPVGGGGLLAGMTVAAKGRKPGIEMVGVESAGYPSAYAALQGDLSLVTGGPTIAEGIAVRLIGDKPLAVIRSQVDALVRVEESAIERAVAMLANVEKVVVEGAGAAGLAALLSDPARYRGRKVGLVLCGGNIDTRLLASVLLRQLVHEQRLLSLSIDIDDQPGLLARVAGCIGDQGGNIVQVHHERLHGGLHVKRATLEVLVEAQDTAHAGLIIAGLQGAGYQVRAGGEHLAYE